MPWLIMLPENKSSWLMCGENVGHISFGQKETFFPSRKRCTPLDVCAGTLRAEAQQCYMTCQMYFSSVEPASQLCTLLFSCY